MDDEEVGVNVNKTSLIPDILTSYGWWVGVNVNKTSLIPDILTFYSDGSVLM